MTLTSLNLIAEILGFISGCLLLWPAVTQNSTLRRRFKLQQKFDKIKDKLGLARTMAAPRPPGQGAEPVWSVTDQWLLTIGAATLVASFVLKIVVVWKTPPGG